MRREGEGGLTADKAMYRNECVKGREGGRGEERGRKGGRGIGLTADKAMYRKEYV